MNFSQYTIRFFRNYNFNSLWSVIAHIKNYFFCDSSSTSIPRSFLQLLKVANWIHDFPLTAMTGTSKHVVPNNDADTPLDMLFLQTSHLANRRSCRASCQRPRTDRQTLDADLNLERSDSAQLLSQESCWHKFILKSVMVLGEYGKMVGM